LDQISQSQQTIRQVFAILCIFAKTGSVKQTVNAAHHLFVSNNAIKKIRKRLSEKPFL